MKKLFLTIAAFALSFGLYAQEGQPNTQTAPAAEPVAISEAPAGDVVVENELVTTDAKGKKVRKKKPVQYNEKGEIIKTGLNFGPLPAIAFDADKGFQLGAILNIYGFGDGSYYPNPKWKTYLEASWFTKGSMLFQAQFDAKHLIPGVRLSAGVTCNIDNCFDFYGFNGYQSFFSDNPSDFFFQGGRPEVDQNLAAKQLKKKYSPFYKFKRNYVLAKCDFVGRIAESNWYWQAGYHAHYFGLGESNLASVNKGKEESMLFPEATQLPSLYQYYNKWGIISDRDFKGGFSSALRAGFQYDSRDQEGTPQKGIWADAHVIVAPKWLGTTSPYYRYSLTFRHYVTCVPDVLTFAYRLNYQGSFTNSCPWYVLPLYTSMGGEFDKEGLGGYRTTRGLLRSRVIGLDMALYNIEFRYVFVRFKLWNQNIAFGLSAFADGCYVVRGLDMTFKGDEAYRSSYDAYVKSSEDLGFRVQREGVKGKDGLHASFGGGLRFIMNRNFIVAFEYGKTINKQDGFGGFYINLGYLF